MKNIKNWLTNNSARIIAAIIVILLLSVLIKSDSNRKQEHFDKKNDTKTYKLPDGTQVSTSNTKEVTKKELNQLIKTQNKPQKALLKQFSKVKNVTETVTETTIDTIKLAPKDSMSVKNGYSGLFLKDNFSFNYKVDKNEVLITNFKLIDTSTIVSGIKRSWFLGKETETKDIIHSSKNTVTTSIDDVRVKEKKPWYFSDVAIIVYSALVVKTTLTIIK